jgi:hypothetical protein
MRSLPILMSHFCSQPPRYSPALNSMQRRVIEAMTPQLVRPEEMTAVSALNSIRGNAAFIAGLGIAGWIAVPFGAAAAFGMDAATYLCGIGALLAMRRKEFKGGDEGALSWHALAEGWRYALQRKDLPGTYLIDMNAMFFGMPNALFPAFGGVFGNQNVGWLYSAGPVGALLLRLTSGWTSRFRRHGMVIACSAALWGCRYYRFRAVDEVMAGLDVPRFGRRGGHGWRDLPHDAGTILSPPAFGGAPQQLRWRAIRAALISVTQKPASPPVCWDLAHRSSPAEFFASLAQS